MVDVYFNELARAPAPLDADRAAGLVRGLVQTLRAVRRIDPALTVHLPGRINCLEVAPGQPLNHLRGQVDLRDETHFLKTLATRAPMEPPREAMCLEDGAPVEYRHTGEPAHGLGLAHLTGGLAVSLPCAQAWKTTRIELECRALEEGEDGTLAERRETVHAPHAAEQGHVAEHEGWIGEDRMTTIRDGRTLVRKVEDTMHHVRLLPDVARTLEAWPGSHHWFGAVRQRLFELEHALRAWQDEPGQPHPRFPSKVTPESESRRPLCRFRDTDGVEREFGDHMRFTPGAGRLHFRLEETSSGTRRAVVAHVGHKLGA
jgi:hypothetical protein